MGTPVLTSTQDNRLWCAIFDWKEAPFGPAALAAAERINHVVASMIEDSAKSPLQACRDFDVVTSFDPESGRRNTAVIRQQQQQAQVGIACSAPTAKPLTGWSSDYYKLHIEHPTSGGLAYDTECNDIIEALGMSFAEGNAFKALWRRAAARKGNGKPGTTALYDAEKVAFFGQRLVEQEKHRG